MRKQPSFLAGHQDSLGAGASSGGQRSRVYTQSLRPQWRTAALGCDWWRGDNLGLLLVSVGGQLMSDPLNNMRDKRTGHTIPRL